VIDNDSQDQTLEIIKMHFPEVELIPNNQNVGYARAVNQGVALSDSEYVMLLNPDIRINNDNLFSTMLKCLDRFPEVAVAAPLQIKQTSKGRQLNFTWSYVKPAALRLYLARLLQLDWSVSAPIPVTFLNAGCLLIRKAAFYHVGKLNEKYFLYGEEPDLFLKLKRYGYESRLLPDVEIVHHRERSIREVSSTKWLRYKIQGAYNICEALVAGYLKLWFSNIRHWITPAQLRKNHLSWFVW
jgi:GT2 family glycosyltransferase